MALIECPECGRQVSEKAASCPQCAYPIATGRTPEPARSQASVSHPSTTPITSSAEFRTRAQPSAWVVILALVGLVVLFSGRWFLGLLFIVVPIIDYMASFIEVTPRVVRVKRGLVSPTTEIQVAKIETVQLGVGIGGWKSVAIVGSGGTLVSLGTLFDAGVLYEQLQAVLNERR